MRALDRKLLRDLRHLQGQVATIALVVACGIAAFVSLQSTWASLERSRIAYYTQYRFGDVFVHLERAPDAVRRRLEAIPGVAEVYVRLVEGVTLPLPSEGQPPPIAEVVSLPAAGQPPLGRLVVQAGRLPSPSRSDEAVLLSRFAERWKLTVGDTVPVVLNGELRRLAIVGLAGSPEFIYPIPRGGGVGVDDQRFAVLWMDRQAVAPVFRMEGVFNDAVLRLQPGASEAAVLREVDRILDPYGGLPAVGRARQPSHAIVTDEMVQLRTWALIVPAIFLAVSAFLVNVVLARLVNLQRPEIAALKALGYRDAEIGVHFLKLVTVVVLIGAVLGVAIGGWLGSELTGIYARIFRFPFFTYRMPLSVPLAGAALSFASAAVGAVGAVRAIARLAPAEAMRPPAPAVYRPLLLERLGLRRFIAPASRMVVRELERTPVRTALSVLGIATGLATLIVGQFSGDAFDYLIDLQFSRITREDIAVTLLEPEPVRIVGELAHLPGVLQAEGVRAVGVRIEAAQRTREIPLIAYQDDAELRRIVSRRDGRVVPLPVDGMLLTQTLGDLLDVRPGDSVTVQVLDGDRRIRRVPVAGFVDELMGLQAYMRQPALHALLGEAPMVSSVLLRVERGRVAEVVDRLNDRRGIAGISDRAAALAAIRKQSGESMGVITLVLTAFAATICIGVVYNNARVALSLRSRDFASLRVLGFTRAEISRTLLSELGLQVLLAVPVGLVLGRMLVGLLVGTVHPERFRFPVVLSVRTYAFATVLVFVSSTLSALVVRRRLDRLDLIGVLKTRE